MSVSSTLACALLQSLLQLKFMDSDSMSDYRGRLKRSTLLALGAAAVSLLFAVVLVTSSTGMFASGWVTAILSIPCFVFVSLAALVFLGGVLGLRRDSLERRGQPYFSIPPRERSPGFVSRLRRRTWSLLSNSCSRLRLWPGELVRVRSVSEIAATLDENGCIDGLPFMSEMLQYCGTYHRVFRRVEKIHDYYSAQGPHLRRLHDAVMLNKLRCNGKDHGGCQASCQFIWKEAWLEVVSEPRNAETRLAVTAIARLEQFACRTSPEGEVRYRCQMTELPRATSRLRWHDPRHYLRDIWSGNVRFAPFMKALALALFNLVQKKTGGPTAPYREAGALRIDMTKALELKPGDVVRVKAKKEIEKTLTKSKNRGLWFDVEMHRFCGGEFRVAERVQTIVHEASGRMLTLKNPCITLEGVTATGEYLGLCPQNELIFWREVWLERAPSFPSLEKCEDSPSS